METLINRYFTYKLINEETKDETLIPLYLPMRTSGNIFIGGHSDFRRDEYIKLKFNHPVEIKINTIDKETGIKTSKISNYQLATTYEDAILYELNFNATEECIVVFDIDNIKGDNIPKRFLADKTEEEKTKWINENVPEIIRNLPYNKSRTKGLPHYWAILDGIDKNILRENTKITTKCLSFCDGDICASHTWENPKSEMYNFNGELPHINFDDIKQYITKPEKFKMKNKPVEIDNTDNETTDEEEEKEIIKEPKKTDITEETEKLEMIKLIMECYTDVWFSDFNNWKHYTMAFKNSFNGKYYNEYDKIVSKYSGYNADNNLKKWSEFKIMGKTEKKYTYNSIIYWAKEQNKEKYYSLCGLNINSNTYIDFERLTEATYANVMYNLYFKDKQGRDLLIFTGDKKIPTGYLFNGIYWVDIGSNMCMIKKGYFNKLYNHYVKEIENYYNNHQFDDSTRIKYMNKIQDLDSKTYRDRIIGIIVDEHWRNIKSTDWNKNNNLFVFENCIYDLEKGDFIKANPEQYINMTCGYEYEDDEFTQEKQEIHNFIDSILGEENKDSEKPYLLKVLSSFLRQCNEEEVAYFFTGKGRNGKGTLSTLLNNVLGSYWGELRMDYYTNYDKGTNTHNQSLYNCRYSRVLNSSEIADGNETGGAIRFITDKFKRITGGDMIEARECGTKETAYFKAGKVLIQTNVLPEFKKIDTSLKERIIVMRFPYTFTNDENLLKSDPNVYKSKNGKLKDKFNTTRFKSAFIQILFENYKEYKKEPLKPPTCVKKYTLDYFDTSSTVKKWFFNRYKYQFEGMTEQEKKAIKKKDYKRILISDLKNKYVEDEEPTTKITDKSFLRDINDIEGFEIGGSYIKKNKDGYYELQQWEEKPEEKEPEEEPEQEQQDTEIIDIIPNNITIKEEIIDDIEYIEEY